MFGQVGWYSLRVEQIYQRKTVAVVIPTRNRWESLVKCVESVQAQTYQPEAIIVVNDGEGVELSGVIMVNTLGNQGGAVARNLGVNKATTDLVAFIDDDCVADSRWLEELVGVMSDEVGFAFGKTIYRSEGYVGHFPERIVNNGDGQWPGGANLIFDRQMFQELGGFNDEFWQYHNEDTELALRAVSAGLRYVTVEAVVYHQPSRWTVASLLASAKNLSVWVKLKKMYPKTFKEFGAPVVGRLVALSDWIYLVGGIVIVPILLIRYWYLGGRDLKLFFAKWPVWLVLRRWWVWRTAWQERVLMV